MLDEKRAYDLLRDGEYGVMSLCSAREGAYGIPFSYVWDGARSIYFHCAPVGRKLDLIREDARASFCVVGRTSVKPGQFTTAYESIVCGGTVSLVADDRERMKALMLLVDKYSPDFRETGAKYAEKSFHRTGVLRLDIETFSGKSKIIR